MSFSAMSGIASAAGMFDVAAQAATRVGAPDAGAGDGTVGMTNAAVAEKINISLLKNALDNERSLVNILA